MKQTSWGLRLLCDAARGVEGLLQLEAHIDVDNAASQRVAQAAGYMPAGEIDDEDANGDQVIRLLFVRHL